MSNADKALRHDIKKLWELLWLLIGSSGGAVPGGLGAAWVPVSHAQSPFAAAAGQYKFLVDSTAGPVTINLAAMPPDAVYIVKDQKGQAAINPITVHPPAGTIEDPSNPGNMAASGVISTQGDSVWWQNDVGVGLVMVVL